MVDEIEKQAQAGEIDLQVEELEAKNSEGLTFEKDTTAVFDDKEPSVITFECDKVIFKDRVLESQWKFGVPLNFEDYDTLVFSGNGKKYTFKKV